MKKDSRIWVAGHTGMVGSAVLRALKARGYQSFILRGHAEADLRLPQNVQEIMSYAPEYVFLCAGRVGGIRANMENQADFLYDNLMIQMNVVRACAAHGITKLINLGSSCMYPRDCPQPMHESMLLSGPLEPSNEGYALAKMAGLRYGEYLRQAGKLAVTTLIPPNLYGPGDNYDPHGSHVVAAMIRRAHDALRTNSNMIEVWGSGTPQRELMYVGDLAAACVTAAESGISGVFNVGTEYSLSVAEIVEEVASVVGIESPVIRYIGGPDGMPLKCMYSSVFRGATGLAPRTSLRDGLQAACEDYRRRFNHRRSGLAATEGFGGRRRTGR